MLSHIESIMKATLELQKELFAEYKNGFKTEEELLNWSENVGKMKTLLDNIRELAEIEFYNTL